MRMPMARLNLISPVASGCTSNLFAETLLEMLTFLLRYIPEVIPDAPNFATVGFSKFHDSFGPGPSSSAASSAEDDDVFKLSQRMNHLNQRDASNLPASQPNGAVRSPAAGPHDSQPTKQVIDGKVYSYGQSQMSPYGSSSLAMAKFVFRPCSCFFSRLFRCPSMKNDLQLALDTAERGKEEDRKKNYPKAFLLYRRALDYFVKVLNAELNQYTRQSLNKTVKAYVIRAEKLKDFLEKSDQLPTDDSDLLEPAIAPPMPFNPNASSIFSTSSLGVLVPESRQDLDIRVGPIVKETQTTFWNDAAPLFIKGSFLRLSFPWRNSSALFFQLISKRI